MINQLSKRGGYSKPHHRGIVTTLFKTVGLRDAPLQADDLEMLQRPFSLQDQLQCSANSMLLFWGVGSCVTLCSRIYQLRNFDSTNHREVPSSWVTLPQ